ncbi:MAG: inositol monophosphatase family protein [Mycobacteriales bacterium]
MPTDAEIDGFLAVAIDLARWAVDEIAGHRLLPAEIETKENAADYVTIVDRAVERQVRDVIAERFPGHLVVGEEFGDESTGAADGELIWYVDPVDGTTNFVFGLPWSSFSLGLADAEGPLVGVVADPHRGEIISAARGRGAFVRTPQGKEAARCARTTELMGAVVLTEWAAFRPWPGLLEMMVRLSEQGATTRIMGSSALSVASAAIGRGSAAVLGGYNTWDVIAAVLIAREAGAVVLGRNGDAAAAVPHVGDGGLLVSAPAIAPKLWSAWTGGGDVTEQPV